MSQPLTSQIEHIVVVMLENRSFDNMLGGLYPPSDAFDGLTGSETNPIDPSDPASETVQVWQGTPGIDAMITPFPDPNEDFDDMTRQLFGSDGVGVDASTVPAMNGFAWNYRSAKSMGGVTPKAVNIMQYYAPGPGGNIPITSALAAAYTFSDRWFASGPVQTFANRLFNHCGTPGTALFDAPYLNDPDYFFVIKVHGGIDDPSIFSTLDAALPKQINWKVYYQDAAETFDLPFGILSALLVKYVRTVYEADNQTQVVQYAQFATDVANDTLPPYSFIEPRYFEATDGRSQSNHPGNAIAPGTTANPMAISVCDGEAFLADIYNTLSATPAVFDKTLLVVIYDEHGGLYDHVPPPAAPSPFAKGANGFDYSRYGVRVPCLLINPYVNRADGVAYRPPSPGNPFDHTSIIRTVFQQFLPSGQQSISLTPRDANAPALTNLIGQGNARIPDVTLPALACPIPPTFFGPSDEAPRSRRKLMDAIAEVAREQDPPART